MFAVRFCCFATFLGVVPFFTGCDPDSDAGLAVERSEMQQYVDENPAPTEPDYSGIE